MAISDKDNLKLYSYSAGLCNFCKKNLIDQVFDNNSNMGERAHIYGKRPGSARYIPEMDNNDSYDNLILLCQQHHKLIDDHPNRYPADVLYKIKSDHEGRVKNNPILQCTADAGLILGIFSSFNLMHLNNIFNNLNLNKIPLDIMNIVDIQSVLEESYSSDYPFKDANLDLYTNNLFFFARKFIDFFYDKSLFQEIEINATPHFSLINDTIDTKNQLALRDVWHTATQLRIAFNNWYLYCKQSYGV